MKKTLITLLLCCAFSIQAFATDDLDLSALSDEELYTLKVDVDREVNGREILSDDVSIISKGKYVVGEDIKAGRYCFVGANPRRPEIAFVLPNKESNSFKDAITEMYLKFGEEYIVTIEDGQMLRFDDDFGIKPNESEEKAFWQP